ncbi:MAG: hypothetical protein AAGG72_00015 [Pseudomonadota bacterium]
MKSFAAFLTTLAALIQMISANAREHARRAEREEGRRLGRWEAADEAIKEALAFLGAAQDARARVRRQLSDEPDDLRLPDEHFRGGDPAAAENAD